MQCENKAKQWTVFLLFLPVIAPLSVMGIDELIYPYEIKSSYIGLFLTLPSVAIILYLLFAAAVLVWGRDKTFTQRMEASGYFPLQFSVLMFVFTLIVSGISITGINMMFAVIMGLAALMYGLLFVVLARALTYAVKKWSACEFA